MSRFLRFGKAVWTAYRNSIVWFTIGAVSASFQAFVILGGIWHLGICK